MSARRVALFNPNPPIGLLVVQICVVFLFGSEPKKRRIKEIEPDAPVSPYPANV
jgi:hypothetical protein